MKNITEFQKRVYEFCKKVPKGKVTSYKEIARALNCKAYRAVGSALGKNPYAPIVPCHRVINSDGRLGGFGGGLKKKVEMLKKEGVIIKNNKVDKRFFYYF